MSEVQGICCVCASKDFKLLTKVADGTTEILKTLTTVVPEVVRIKKLIELLLTTFL